MALRALFEWPQGLKLLQEYGLTGAGREGNQAGEDAGAGVLEIVFDSGGNADGGTGPELDELVIDAVFTFAGEHVEDFFAVGMKMGWVAMAGEDVADAECLSGARGDFGVHEPFEGSPFEAFVGKRCGVGEVR